MEIAGRNLILIHYLYAFCAHSNHGGAIVPSILAGESY
jgi:hypothetical protein